MIRDVELVIKAMNDALDSQQRKIVAWLRSLEGPGGDTPAAIEGRHLIQKLADDIEDGKWRR